MNFYLEDSFVEKNIIFVLEILPILVDVHNDSYIHQNFYNLLFEFTCLLVC